MGQIQNKWAKYKILDCRLITKTEWVWVKETLEIWAKY